MRAPAKAGGPETPSLRGRFLLCSCLSGRWVLLRGPRGNRSIPQRQHDLHRLFLRAGWPADEPELRGQVQHPQIAG